MFELIIVVFIIAHFSVTSFTSPARMVMRQETELRQMT